MNLSLDQNPIWSGCFLLVAGLAALFLVLYLVNYFAGFEL
jgi:ABC-type transporter Mla subunit MlaD